MRQAHENEIDAAIKGPVHKAVFDAIKNVVVFRDVPGAGSDAVDQEATRIARAKIEQQVLREFASKAREET
jgi:hypothetical protein